MKLADLGNEIRDHVEQGKQWLERTLEDKVPALLDEVGKFQASPIVQALEGVVLPPDVEQEIANVVKAFIRLLSQEPAEQQPTPAAPAAVVADPAEGEHVAS